MANSWTSLSLKRVNRRRLLVTGAALSAGSVAFGVVACGGDDDGPATTEPGSPRASQPKRGGNLFILNSIPGDQPHFDVQATSHGGLHTRSSGIVYARLIRQRLEAGHPAGKIVIPEGLVAASWEQPEEGTYTFKLRPNVKWHNIPPVNGRSLTAQDVVYSTERQYALKALISFMPGIDKASAIDATTVRITLKKPDPDFINVLTAPMNKLVAREAVELKGDLKEGPVIGASGWIFKEWKPNANMLFDRNPDYWRGTQFPYADSLNIVSEEAKRKLLHDNATRMYRVWPAVPAA